jgi:dCTP deaminase
MTALSNQDIKRELLLHQTLIVPCPEAEAIQPNSVDVKLWNRFHNPFTKQWFFGSYKLMPLEFILGSTYEKVNIPAHLVCRVEGKSSHGRVGVTVHQTAGLVDSGFYGRVTLEFFNCSPEPIELIPNTYIAQLSFMYNNTPAFPLYNGRYQGQMDTTAARPAKED